jgi:DNA-binding CsgD family transcriptional regulator
LLAEGLISKQVAERLNISPQTVNKHRANILKKTATSTTGELINLAVKSGWI